MPEGEDGAVGPGGPGRPTPGSWRDRWRRRWRSRKVVVRDRSMEPALRPGDRLRLDPQAFRTERPRRGDVVVVRDPSDPERWLLKRVVGVPGDFVRVTAAGATRVAGPSPTGTVAPAALEEMEVPPEHLFVLSDRALGTRDSRQFGPVALRTVAGKVWFRYHPASRRGPVGPGEGLSEP